MNINELKAAAYDSLAAIQFHQARLAELNAQIQKQVEQENVDKNQEKSGE
jgi:hypothetical protein